VIATHPDDEVLGCGGIIRKFAVAGADIHVLIVTRGVPDIFPEELIKETRRELSQAHDLLGVTNTHFLDFPAPRLDTVPVSEVATAIKGILDAIKPDEVYIPHVGDMHIDHRITGEAAMVACRPRSANKLSGLYAYETLSETDWAAPFAATVFIPNYFVDITQELDDKLRAMSCYKTQLYPIPSNRSLESLTALARLRGGTIYVPYAEAFEVIRIIR